MQSGVKQGDLLSPILVGLCIDGLVTELKITNFGIKIENIIFII